MSDIVKKYQHYFNESVKLQEMVNEQAAYIAELEEALLALSEDLTTDEREKENDAAINKAENAAYRYLSPDNPKGMWNRKTGKPKSAAHLAKGEKLERDELAVRDAADLEREHPTKIFGKGGKVVGTTGNKKSMFKLGYVDNPNYEEGK
jgi:hypothetical protein